MIKIGKDFRVKIITIIVSILFLSHNLLYASSFCAKKDALRVPVGNYNRMAGALPSNKLASNNTVETKKEIVKNAWVRLHQLGSLEDIRNIDLIDFARALGAKIISHTGVSRPIFTLGEEQYSNLETLRKTGKLPPGISESPYIYFKDNSEINSPGIYVCPAELKTLHEKLSSSGEKMRYNKGSFVHELLEQEFSRAGVIDGILHKFRQHTDARVLEEEILFDALMGDKDLTEGLAILTKLKEIEDQLLSRPDEYFRQIQISHNRVYGGVSIENISRSLGENSPYYFTISWALKTKIEELKNSAMKRWNETDFSSAIFEETLASNNDILILHKLQEEIRTLIKNGAILNRAQCMRFLENKFKIGEIDIGLAGSLVDWFNSLDLKSLVDPKQVQYIEIGAELQKINIIQSDSVFTAEGLLELVDIFEEVPSYIRSVVKTIERRKNQQSDIPAHAESNPETKEIFIPDSFYSVTFSNKDKIGDIRIIRDRNKHVRRDSLIHEIFELYVTADYLDLIQTYLEETHKSLNQRDGSPVDILSKFGKRLESTLLARWVKAKGYVVDRDAFDKYLKTNTLAPSWVNNIHQLDVDPTTRQELIEIVELLDMLTSCRNYADIWYKNKYETSQHSINPAEDLVEACCMFFLEGHMYRQRVASHYNSSKDLVYLISYLILRNGPFKGIDYGRHQNGDNIFINYLGNDVTGEKRIYHIEGPMYYGGQSLGNTDFYITLANEVLPLIGDELVVTLPATTELNRKISSKAILKDL